MDLDSHFGDGEMEGTGRDTENGDEQSVGLTDTLDFPDTRAPRGLEVPSRGAGSGGELC